MRLDSMNTLLKQLQSGGFIIVYDEHREKEADFFCLAEHITSEKVNFLLTHAKGMICVACDKSILRVMNLSLLCEENMNPHGTNFCMPFDAVDNCTTGVSANDRASSISCLVKDELSPTNIVIPGHTHPLLAKTPTERFGHTEAGVELAKKADRKPAMVICEILNKEGEKASFEEVQELAKKYNVPMTTLESLRSSFLG